MKQFKETPKPLSLAHKAKIFKEERGFALIAVVVIMVLVTLLAIGLLSLSAISARSSDLNAAQAEARANARLALVIALGKLQEYSGPDTRVTAPADIVEEDAPRIVGVWKSWEGTDHTSSGIPIRPDYASKTQPATSSSGRFISWLISGAEEYQDYSTPSNLAFLNPTGDTIPLLSEGSLGDNPGQIHVQPEMMVAEDGSGISGAYAWWVSPENQKASIGQPYEPRTGNAAGWAELGQSHSISDPEIFGLTSMLDDRESFNPRNSDAKPGRKAVTRKSISLIESGNTVEPDLKFHDFSAGATGLLTNTATGGWRKDLSILTEKWDNIYARYPSRRLPLFRYAPQAGATSQVPKPTTSSVDPPQCTLYPWSAYSTIIGNKAPNTHHAAAASWQSLQSFATSYKNFTYSGNGVTSPFVWDKISSQRSLPSDKIYNYQHQQRLYTQIARFQFLVYAQAMPRSNSSNYDVWLKYVPLFTLWNPYNVTLELSVNGTLNAGQGSGQHEYFRGFGWRRSLPGAMAIVPQTNFPNPDNIPSLQYRMISNGNFQFLDIPGNHGGRYDTFLPGNVAKYGGNSKWLDARTWGCWLPEGTLTFKPGEAKMISPDFIDPGYGFGGTAMRMEEGYDAGNIVGPEFRVLSNLPANRPYWFVFRPDRLTQPYDGRDPGAGFSLSFGDGGSHFGGTSQVPSGIGSEYHNITALVDESQANTYWPLDEVDEIGYTVGELVGRWTPLFSISFGPRMTIGTGANTVQNRPTKGVVQNSPLAAMVLSDPASGEAKDHPANNTFDFAFHSLPSNSTITPGLTPSEGYIATGYQKGDGLSRLVMVDIPLRPMASLVELQGWNPRGSNPSPPFQMNLIGNSDATPLIPYDKVVPNNPSSPNPQLNLMHDDSYCANHLLFDDWFVSSIAPQPQNLGGNIAKDIEEFYEDVLTGDDELTNRAYNPIAEDSGLSGSELTARVNEIINSADGWLKIASRLEVDGMFNVNSTSVEAWKALLGNARSREQIAVHGAAGLDTTTSSTGHAFTKGAVASDIEAGTGSGVGAAFDDASEYTGFRSLTDDQIDDLANKIVEQVRLRGPFLSLSEFVNRSLDSNTDISLAGPIQTAINNLTDDPMEDLRDPNNSLSDNTMYTKSQSDNDWKDKLEDVGYEFPEAADGDSAYGAPGWMRQADVLRPIAPVLSARDDTFTIRTYGDARDANGNIIARAWCEAVVMRTRDFCDDASDTADTIDPPTGTVNTKFGRRYKIVSFRWLNSDEV